jgi:DNA-binding NarL/FixJ family response regulator
LLLDINMPGKSGIDVLKYVKENGLKCRTTKLTGQVGFSKGMESMKLGAQGYITKDALELQPDGQIEKSDLNIDFLLMTIKRVFPGE